MSIVNCPFCNSEVDAYAGLEGPEDAETVIEEDFTHSREWECERGCQRVTNSYFAAYCESCDHEFDVLDTYIQPCNANGYSVDIKVFKQVPDDVYREWMGKEPVSTQNS